MGKIVFTEHLHHIANAIHLFERHHRLALFAHGIVHAHGNMHLGVFHQFAQCGFHTHGRHGDALRTPRKTPFGGENFNHFQHGVDVVEGLAHAHKHDVGERMGLRYAQHLVDDLVGCEIAVKALTTGHTKIAVHAASLLRGDAQCGAVGFGNVNALHLSALAHIEEVFHCAVGAFHGTVGSHQPHAIFRFQALAIGFGDVEHLVEISHSLAIYPLSQLGGSEFGHSQRRRNAAQFVERHTCQWLQFFRFLILHIVNHHIVCKDNDFPPIRRQLTTPFFHKPNKKAGYFNCL